MRDDFATKTKEVLAKRVGHRCSNAGCRQQTSGPRSEPDRAISVGVAAHITAAAPGGPRYDESLIDPKRKHPDNGIWLCQNCAKLIDGDPGQYTVDILRHWKLEAEAEALREIAEPRARRRTSGDEDAVFEKIENLMPELLDEMRNDLELNPLKREFVLLKKNWVYLAKGNELVYYYEDHNELDNKLSILQNLGFVIDITSSKVDRYRMTEQFVDYLKELSA